MQEDNNAKISYDNWWEELEVVNELDPGTIYRNNLIIGKIGSLNVQNVADIGCGSGQLIKNILKRLDKIKLTGFDVSEKIIEKNKKIYKDADFFCLNLNEYDLNKENEGKYDMVIFAEVIEHLGHWEKALKTISKMVRKGGYVIVTTQSGKIYKHHKQIGHLKHFRRKEITDELRKNRIKILESYYSGWPFMNLKNILVNIVYKDIENLSTNKEQSLVNRLAYKIFGVLYKISSRKRGPQIFILGKKI